MQLFFRGILLLLSLIPQILVANELRCGGSLISASMTREQVKSLCGEPAVRDSQESAYQQIDKDGKEKTSFEHREIWLIDQDPGSFIRVVTFYQAIMESVRTLDQRGLAKGSAASICNDGGAKIVPGTETILVKYFCGSPFDAAMVSEEFTGKTERRLRVRTEQWRYFSGTKELLLTIRGGRVSNVGTL